MSVIQIEMHLPMHTALVFRALVWANNDNLAKT